MSSSSYDSSSGGSSGSSGKDNDHKDKDKDGVQGNNKNAPGVSAHQHKGGPFSNSILNALILLSASLLGTMYVVRTTADTNTHIHYLYICSMLCIRLHTQTNTCNVYTYIERR